MQSMHGERLYTKALHLGISGSLTEITTNPLGLWKFFNELGCLELKYQFHPYKKYSRRRRVAEKMPALTN